jgi:ribosomal protein S18 acetylase RimI-like enzyme
MTLQIVEVEHNMLPIYAEIPQSFTVESEYRVEPISDGLGGLSFSCQKVKPYSKYIEQTDPPERWPKQFGKDKLGLLMAFKESRLVGGAAVVLDLQIGMTTPFDKEGIAALWDIRVQPEERNKGIGSMVLQSAASWAKERGCTYMRIETQNTNVPACKLYAKNGCTLIAIHRQGYASTKEAKETMLLWQLDL